MKQRMQRFAGRVLVLASVCAAVGPALATSEPIDRGAIAAGRELSHRLARHLQTDSDPRQQLIAALLLSMPIGDDGPPETKDAAAARLLEAQAIFARVRAGTDDPWILWVTATDCRFGAQLCDADGAIDHLLRIESDNSAVWQLALARAHRAEDRDGTLAALRGMAASTRDDSYFNQAVREWASAYARLEAMPELDHLVRRFVSEHDAARALTRGELIDLMRLNSLNYALAFGIPALAPFSETCKPELLADIPWIEACRAAARVLLDSETLFGTMVGTSIAYRMASDDQERARIEQARRQSEWLTESVVRVGLDGVDAARKPDPAEARELVRRWLAGPSEIEAMRTLLRDRGMPLEPPPDFRGRGPSLAERDAERLQARQ